MYNALLFARALTTKVSYVPGSRALLEQIRQWGTQHDGTIVVNDFDGDLKFELSLSGDDDSRIFWYGALAQPVMALLDRLLQPGATLLDIGAGAGEIALFSAKRVGQDGRVVALEDREGPADRLTRNLALNKFDHVDVIRKISTLEALLDEGWFTRLDVLKIGRHHVHRELLEGGRAVFDAFSPVILLEGGDPDAADVSRWLGDHGYRFYRVDRERNLPPFTGAPPFPWAVACPEGVDVG